MCGIVAIISRDNPVCSSVLLRAVSRLRHRGPDDISFWIAPNGTAGLGHVRLSIIDLAGGGQPISNERGTVWAVTNGEFYAFEQIRRDLLHRGHRLATDSDSEILVHLYEEYGPGCLDHLRGEFAFVLWDDARQRMFAARDRFGIKPLLYYEHRDFLVFASEAKALLEIGVDARWDEDAVFQHLHACMDQTQTLFAGIRQIKPGHYMLASASATRLIRYWELDYPAEGHEPACSEHEYQRRLRHQLEEAVRVRLRADVPVGCLLSGGLDSSAILGIAARHAADPLAAFTVSFDDAAYDETTVARGTAALNGVDLHVVPVSQLEFARHFADVVWQGETFAFNAHAVAKYVLSKAVHDAGYKVVLSGEGADEIFAGYLFSAIEFCSRSESSVRDDDPLANLCDRPGGHSQLLRGLWETRRELASLLAPEFAQKFAASNPYETLLAGVDQLQLAGRHVVTQSLYLWAKSLLPNYVLAAEKLDMAHAVEVRMPFFDHAVFDIARDAAVHWLYQHGREKHVLREAVRPYLTDDVYRSPKHPFTAPPVCSPRNRLFFEFLQDTLRGTATKSVPFFDQRSVVALLDGLPALPAVSRIKHDVVLLIVLSACVLHDRYRM
jgi:asparagine synthase (glutamine-hydrolysing)